ncbi:glutathione S-transferase TCHQD [Aristolochia californica]|uniref:glutathione S-transferase TCHQD n=1 Tax=Aristolochia californica TaxID=171875 RepID=UPI0035E27C86
MQLYHHPYSMDSQKVRIALEEEGLDYTSFHANPLTGKNMDTFFFRMNNSGKLPVFQNGAHRICETIDIIQYIHRIALLSSRCHHHEDISDEVIELMWKIQRWDPTLFTLSHTPTKYRNFITKFLRRVAIARMADAPDLASAYHAKLREAYKTEDELKNASQVKMSEEQLSCLLDELENKLNQSKYLSGQEFGVADYIFVPVLARIKLLNLEEVYIASRLKVAEYWKDVQKRPSYKVVIGNYFSGWRKYHTLFKTVCFLIIRSAFRKY